MLRLYIHPDNPQNRLIQQATQAILDEKVIIIPTTAGYTLACLASSKSAVERIVKIRNLSDKYQFTLLCQDLSQIGRFAEISNQAFRLLKSHTLSDTSFIFTATKEVPKRLIHPKNKTIALNIASHNVSMMLLEQLQENLVISSLIFNDELLADPDDIALQCEKTVDLFLDAGYGSTIPSSIVDLSGDNYHIVRHGLGDVSIFD